MTFSTNELRNAVAPDALAIRVWRRSHKLTQRELAKIAGVSEKALHRCEIGKNRMRAITKWKLMVVIERWDESMRPVKVERRGVWKRAV